MAEPNHTGWATRPWVETDDGQALLNGRYVTKLFVQNNGPEWLVNAVTVHGEMYLLARYGSLEEARESLLRGPI